ncbi:FlgB family protein [Oceaniglobus ichthyenteri]|uniref:FlgB family protein n=1 Tax=Oceaniglobus ichthyenteri TaxID=2136177 RepID=UPI000D3A0FE8|nr:FlgB family protein [Oceaniglobus ichthyenteri]
MFHNIEMMQTAQAMARHASDRQMLIARNVANADTPGYRAQDMPSFTETLDAPTKDMTLRATRAAHITDGIGAKGQMNAIDSQAEAAPNGNTVSIEQEMVKAAEVRQQHDMAMAIYSKGRDILRASLGRG